MGDSPLQLILAILTTLALLGANAPAYAADHTLPPVGHRISVVRRDVALKPNGVRHWCSERTPGGLTARLRLD